MTSPSDNAAKSPEPKDDRSSSFPIAEHYETFVVTHQERALQVLETAMNTPEDVKESQIEAASGLLSIDHAGLGEFDFDKFAGTKILATKTLGDILEGRTCNPEEEDKLLSAATTALRFFPQGQFWVEVEIGEDEEGGGSNGFVS